MSITRLSTTKDGAQRLITASAGKFAASIKPNAGRYGAGLITGCAIITYGVARGHKAWIDRRAMEQIEDKINKAPNGIKSRFSHPYLFDGIGTVIGMFRDARIDGDKVRADLHILQSASKAPGGDLAAYILALAAEAPHSFGLSIVFTPDHIGEQLFWEEHSVNGPFRSPDKANVNNYPHIRLKTLDAVDFVDEPAANPDGLFRVKSAGSVGEPDSQTAARHREWKRRAREIMADQLETEALDARLAAKGLI